MKIKKSQLKEIIKEGIKAVLKEKKKAVIKEEKMSPEQMKFAKPIFQAAAKKGKFKIKKMYMSFQPQAEVTTFAFGKDGGSMTSIWGHSLNKKDALLLKKAWEQADMDLKLGEFKPKFHISPESQYITLYEAAKYAGIKYDGDEYDRLFRKGR